MDWWLPFVAMKPLPSTCRFKLTRVCGPVVADDQSITRAALNAGDVKPCNRFQQGGHADGEGKQVAAVPRWLRRFNDHLLGEITKGTGLPVTSKNLHNLRRETNVSRTMGRTGDLWTDPEIEGR